MKSFAISLCVFTALLLTILLNCLFVDRTMDTLEAALAALPSCNEAAEGVAALEAYWDKSHNELSFSISFDEMREMDDCLVQLRIAAKAGNSYEFELARALGFDAIRHMRRLERFSWDGIF